MRTVEGKRGRVCGQFGNIWVMAHLDMMKGETVPVGEHAFDHVSWLERGSVKLIIEGAEPVIYHAQNYILIPKGMRHSIEVLEDHTNWTCLHVVLDSDGQPDPSLDHYRHLLSNPQEELHASN